MFSENNYGKDYFSISKDELQLHVCQNERDVDESLRSIAEYYIYLINSKRIMKLPSPVNINRIKKFKDLCDEDIVNTNILRRLYFLLEKLKLFADASQMRINFEKYGLPIFIILSLFGNCLSAIVLFRKKMRSLSSNIYLGVLAICDITYSMTLLIQWLVIMNIISKINWYWFVIFTNFLRFFSQFLSVWLIVAFTIERYIVTKYPLLRRSWCTVKRTKIVIITLTGLAILLSILYVFIISEALQYEIINNKTFDVYHFYKQAEIDIQKNTAITRMILNSIIIFILPAVVIVICNTLIGYNIYQQNRVRKTQISSDKMLQHKVTKILVLVSSIFVLLKLPDHFFIYFLKYIPYYHKMLFIGAIFQLLDRTHYCINFFLYCLTGPTFRRELIRIFKKRTNIRGNRNIMKMDNYK